MIILSLIDFFSIDYFLMIILFLINFFNDYFFFPITVIPFIYGTNANGTFIEPSFCWQFSITALNALDVAIAVLFNVWTYSFSSPFLYLMFSLAAWYEVQLEHETTSRYFFSLGIKTSRSYFFAATVPMSPVQMSTTRYGSLSFLNNPSEFLISSS